MLGIGGDTYYALLMLIQKTFWAIYQQSTMLMYAQT